MSLTFRSVPPTFEDAQDRRRELEQQEVDRGLLSYLLRTATLVFAVIGSALSSLVLWRRYHPLTGRPSGWLIACCVVFWILLGLRWSFWSFRRMQQRVQLRGNDGFRQPL